MIELLKSAYGINVTKVTPAIGGWSASAYIIESTEGAFFLKEYDKGKSGRDVILEKMDLSMAVASWLEQNTGLKGRINAPLLTNDGNFKIEINDHTYLLFSYIDGVTIRTTPLSSNQQKEIAEIVGELHRHGSDMPFDFSSIQETYEIPCVEFIKMQHCPDNPLFVHQQYDMLMRAIDVAHVLADRAKSKQPAFVLCHTDIHGWNLMQSNKLILIDWESIRYAPVEADLFTFWGDWYWGDSKWGSYWDTFLPIYQKYHPEYTVNEKLQHNEYLYRAQKEGALFLKRNNESVSNLGGLHT